MIRSGAGLALVLGLLSAGCASRDPYAGNPVELQRIRQRAVECLKRGVHYRYLPSVRAQAIESLEQSAPREGLDWIRSALTDEHPAVRFAACMALGTLKDETSRASLRHMLDDENNSVKVAAIYALHRLGDISHTADLAYYLTQNDDLPAKRNAVLALGRLGETGAIPLLAKLVEKKDEALHAQALESLALLGDERARRQLAFEALSGTGPKQVFAINALQATGERRYQETFRQGLRRGDFPEVRLAAARALGVLGSDEGFKVALDHIDFSRPKKGLENDPAENQLMRIRQLAALALGAIGKTKALPRLIRRLEDNSDPRVQVASARAILQIVNKQDEQALPFALSGSASP